MVDAIKNFAYSLVATAPSPATSGTSLVVTSGTGTVFPAAPFNATIWPPSTQPSTTNAEIVRVTAVSTDTLTITRAQYGTSAQAITAGYQIAQTIDTNLFGQVAPILSTQLVTAKIKSFTVNVPQYANMLLYAGGNAGTVTIGGTAYNISANQTIATASLVSPGSQSVLVSGQFSAINPATQSGGWSVGTAPVALTYMQFINGIWLGGTNSGTAVAFQANSIDGINWYQTTIMPTSAVWGMTGFGGPPGAGYYLTIQYSSNVWAYSTNGTTWTTITAAYSYNYGTVVNAYGTATPWVVFPQGGTLTQYQYCTTTAPTSWTTGTFPASRYFPDHCAAYNPNSGYWTVNVLSTTGAYYSSNGTSWTAFSMPYAPSNGLYLAPGTAVNGGTAGVLAAGQGFTSTSSYNYQTTGTTSWSSSTIPGTIGQNSASWGNGYYWFGLNGSSAWTSYYSQNLTSWTAFTINSASGTNYHYTGSFGNGSFAQGGGYAAFQYSSATATLPVTFIITQGATTYY